MMARISLGLAGALLLAALPAQAVSINFQPGQNQLVSFDRAFKQANPLSSGFVVNPHVTVFENFDDIGKGYALAPAAGSLPLLGPNQNQPNPAYRGLALKAPTNTLAVAGSNLTVNAAVYNSPSSQNGEGARPLAQTATDAGTPLSSDNFASVRQGGSFVISFKDYFPLKPVQVFSFALGSVDGRNAAGQGPTVNGAVGPFDVSGNKVTLYLVDGTTRVFTGSDLTNGAADGNQSNANTNGRVTFDTRGLNGGILGAKFESSVTAFEFDDFAAAVPEPATWGMMIIGFGFAGFGLRRGRQPVAA